MREGSPRSLAGKHPDKDAFLYGKGRETVESNLTGSTAQSSFSGLCSGEALLETEQAKQYALVKPEI